MVVYPVLRIEPTETGSRFALYWTVRGWFRQPDGWLIAVGRVNRTAGVPATWAAVAIGGRNPDLGQMETALRSNPRLRVTSWTREGR